jgi:hypothetical protein
VRSRAVSRGLALAAVVAIVASLFTAPRATAQTGSAGQPAESSQKSKQRVDGLLDRFPIGTDRVQTTSTPAAPAPAEPAPGETARAAADGSGILWPSVLVLAVLLALLGTLVSKRMLQRRTSEPPAIDTLGPLRAYTALAPAGEAWDKSALGTPGERSEPVTDVADDRHPQVEGDELRSPTEAEQSDGAVDGPTTSRDSNFGGVGDRIAGVLEAADAAAAQIRADAIAAAAETKREAAAQMKEAEIESARLRSEAQAAAEETRAASESFATTHRRRSEEEAQKVLAEADSQARATRQAAEEMALRIETEARARENELRAEVRTLEKKVHRALEAFRDISTELEDLLAANAEPQETLVEALAVASRAEKEPAAEE